MEKWIFVNNITSLDKMYHLVKTINENIVTESNHAELLMKALNENGASRNEANSHPINYVLFYNMVYNDGSVYKLTLYGKKLLDDYKIILEDKKYKSCFFFEVMNKIKYPNDAVETSDIYKVHPFYIIFKLLCEKRLKYYITVEEFESFFSAVENDDDYEKIINIILKSRAGEKVERNIEKIAQVPTVVAGWCNQFNVMKKDGEKIMLSDDLNTMLPVLSNVKSVMVMPYSLEFANFVIRKYLFEGQNMAKIEQEYYQNNERRGFLVKDVLDYFQINNEANKAIYKDQSIEFVCSLLDVQSDDRYLNLGKIIRGESFLSNHVQNSNKSILEQFIEFYDENIGKVRMTEKVASDELKSEFLKEYPIHIFKTMALKKYSLGLGDPNTFCRQVEHGKYSSYGVSCNMDPNGSGHWGIYFSEKDKAYKDHDNNIIDKPNDYWNKFKSELYNFLTNLENKNPRFSTSFPMLRDMTKTLAKLCFMYYPDKFLNCITKGVLQELYDVFELEYDTSTPADKLSYDLNEYIRSNVPNARYEKSEYISSVIGEFRDKIKNMKTGDNTDKINEPVQVDDIDRLTGAYNIIYYGVPGSGKSFQVNEDFNENDYKIERTTFHPEYTNSDFVGQIIPTVKNNKVEYEFHPGAFTNALKYALENKDKKVCLIIEEINRGNASAIFGDIFQLLDRNVDGKSRYSIFNGPITDYLKNNYILFPEIYIPSNMWIVATMNTSDQNVFTLDTAFKRRWKKKYIKNVFADNKESKDLRDKVILDSKKYPNVTWGNFVEKINKHILSDTSGINGEDKQLGMYFVTIEEIENSKEFAEKILSYLWEDVAKINPSYWFGSISSYDELIELYEKSYLDVFNTIFEEDIKVDDNYTIKTIGE